MNATELTDQDVRAEIAKSPVWYHTLELAPGVLTPGFFDLRGIVDKLPWPEVKGKRCLDIASFDGFYTFELERRGAAEVVAVDVPGPEDFDWPPALRDAGVSAAREWAPEHAAGFDVAKRVLGSQAERKRMSVYDLSPDTVGTFDVVTCGSLLLHLRDPLRALEAIRSVCDGHFLSNDQVDVPLTIIHPRRPVSRLDGVTRRMQWTIPNVAARVQMLEASGFEVKCTSRILPIGYGPSHSSSHDTSLPGPRQLLERLFAGGPGVTHHAALSRPKL